jgi:CBS-domain-containing membrane protein
MQASDVMDPNPSTLKPDDSIEYAVKFIRDKRYRSLPIIDENGCYIGMFGVNCLIKQVIPKAVFMHRGLENVSFIHESLDDLYDRFAAVKDEPIIKCISMDIKSLSPNTPLTETLLQLYSTQLSIPVVEQGSNKLLGMISYWDVEQKILQAGAKKHD